MNSKKVTLESFAEAGERLSGPDMGTERASRFTCSSSCLWDPLFVAAEAMLKDRLPGVFVVRDSTSFRGSFGLVMKVDPYNVSPTGCHAGRPLTV